MTALAWPQASQALFGRTNDHFIGEEGGIAGAVEHLRVELRLRGIPHEIAVVDDGSTDSTWERLSEIRQQIPQLNPVQNALTEDCEGAWSRGVTRNRRLTLRIDTAERIGRNRW